MMSTFVQLYFHFKVPTKMKTMQCGKLYVPYDMYDFYLEFCSCHVYFHFLSLIQLSLNVIRFY